MDYWTVKLIHQTTVALSIAGFFVRGLAQFSGAGWPRGRMARTLPHVVDTALLLSALALAWMLQLSPLSTPWLLAKIAGLLAYIALGMVALRPNRSRSVAVAAWLSALLTASWIVSVAISKNPLGFLAGLLS